MSYRFTDTSKWGDEWFIDLKPSEKLMFMYLCDNCDMGGFFELSLRKLSFDLGISTDQVKASLKGLERGYILSVDRRILFVKNFLKHQKNLPLNPDNKAHKGIFRRFDNYKERFEYNLLEIINDKVKLSEIKGASEGLGSPSGNGKGNNKEIGEYKGVDFENFWNLYSKKVGDKKSVVKKWMKLDIETQSKILSILPSWKKQFDDIQYQPFPETFLNQQRWNDDLTVLVKNNLVKKEVNNIYIPPKNLIGNYSKPIEQ